jgi:hypothetical protein
MTVRTGPHTRDDSADRARAADAALAEVLLTPEGRAEPYSRYKRLRELDPVHHSGFGMWIISRYDDVDALLRDSSVGKDVRLFMQGRFGGDWEEHASLRRMGTSMLWANPPEHTRLRRIVNNTFTVRRVAALEGFIEKLADELLDPIARAGGGDILNEFCYPLPLQVIAELLGVPQRDAPSLREPMRDFQRTFELGLTADELLQADAGAEFSDEYFRGLVAAKRAEPADDLLSALIAHEDDDGGKLSEIELIGYCNMIMGAGFETTTHLLANGLNALLSHPDQLARLRADPELVEPAVEEILRYDPPVHLVLRMNADPVTVGGVEIPGGQVIATILAGANRDPDRFTDPERFDIGRREGLPISFSAGIHHCLGWALAKLQAEVVLRVLLRRFDHMELVAEPVRRPRLTLRGFETLDVKTVEGDRS